MINEFRGEYYFLSNFYEAPIEYKGITYTNNESAFQSIKCINEIDRKQFANLNPSQAKSLGRRVKLRTDWEQIKYSVMYGIVKAKFSQNNDLYEKLVATGEECLEEGNTWGDRFWGTVNGFGENELGKILMRVRAELQYEKLNENY